MQTLLNVEGLSVGFRSSEGISPAIDDVSFKIASGEMVGIVGESGSGKSVTGYTVLGLSEDPAVIKGGTVRLGTLDMLSKEATVARGSVASMIFQNPMNALSPTSTIGTQMDNVLRRELYPTRSQRRQRILEVLEKVSLDRPEQRLAQYPHELSGGLLQRVCIAMALLNGPKLLIADEPTTALDVTTQAQISATVRQLCREEGVGLIWISHDLALLSNLVDRILVMYAGQIVESGTVEQIFSNPSPPYTLALLRSVPSLNRGRRRLSQIAGSMDGSPEALAGCRFRSRCEVRFEPCDAVPPMFEAGESHYARCWRCEG